VPGLRDILDRPAAYRLWQAPFAEQKMIPLKAHNDLGGARRVLDVGCGPGTNARHFRASAYVGMDFNRRYVKDAHRRTGCLAAAADARRLPARSGWFDFVLVNSMLHHIDDAGVHDILADLARVVAPGGHVHVLELVLPAAPSVARLLARLDRGQFARPEGQWHALLASHFDPVIYEPFVIEAAGVACWRMVYFKGRVPAT
jgi:ubiquinone/menaquinone biosynthesis C-methylase UbiE